METEQKNKIMIVAVIIAIILFVFLFAFIFTGGLSTKKSQSKPTNIKNITYDQESGKEYTKKDIEKQKEDFYKKNPLVEYLPYYGNHFQVEYLSENNKIIYKIKLHTYLNDADQFENNKEDYAQYKIEALEWIKSKGVDYKKLDIEWQPEDPKNISIEENSSANISNCKTCE